MQFKKYKSKLNLFAHVHKHKQAKYITYRPINTCKSMRWLRLFSSTSFANRGDILLTEHRKLCSGFTRRFFVFDLIVRKVKNPCSHSHVVENMRS